MAAMRRVGYLALAACAAAPAAAQDLAAPTAPPALEVDDECAGAGADQEQCGLSAIQMRGQKAATQEQAAAEEVGKARWPNGLRPPAPAPMHAPAPIMVETKCKSIDAPQNRKCKEAINWILNQGGKFHPEAPQWFEDMKSITGVDYMDATEEDFQRMYFCSPPGGKACGAPPCSCSTQPCTTCYGGAPAKKARPECANGEQTIACVPPRQPLDYNGMAWTTLRYPGTQEMHIFAIGDWGGMDGSLNPVEGRTKLMAFSWGARKGPTVFPRTRWNRYHTVELCDHDEFVKCYDTHGEDCPESCGYVQEVDEKPQQLVAQAMAERAKKNPPQYVLNVGDNFYWGGIEKTCGTPMHEISFTAHHQFDQVFEKVYDGIGEAPWLSVLGNHDWGGRQFVNGWDQQIAYTWASNRWIMPAAYFMVHVEYPDQDFTVDIYMIDTNFMDAKDTYEDADHNICGPNNPAGADCSHVGGPSSIYQCKSFFQKLWADQKTWITNKLRESRADWQITVTHFPCGQDGEHGAFYRHLRREGLDLLVTGHRHDQELWRPGDNFNYMGDLACFVTGGGGGISSEATPDPNNKEDWFGEAQYGFFDLTITKDKMTIESINWDGTVAKSTEIQPHK